MITGAHAARRQLFFFLWAVDAFLCCVGEGLVEPRVTHARPLLSTANAAACVLICIGGGRAGHVWAQGRMLCGDN